MAETVKKQDRKGKNKHIKEQLIIKPPILWTHTGVNVQWRGDSQYKKAQTFPSVDQIYEHF